MFFASQKFKKMRWDQAAQKLKARSVRACSAHWYAKLIPRACVKAPSEWVAPKLTQDAWMAMLLVAAAENWVKPPASM